ncbi:GMC family oxidoreductase [Thalassotalea crassostreae]|uniref:GMC family oxidoreductase n=1 Tax=Thalassotalea crassostreae TaxID=1763536 RepID=UPI000837CC91|nr:GMC family oxidoreductase N-terminal domain-containing protein [Thalassotalea crassostreae]
MGSNYDFIIVGAGSSGCVLANKLSKCGKYSVCLIEPGSKNNNPLVNTPIGIALLMQLKTFNYSFNSINQPHQDNRQIFQPRGKGLGGSSAINAMLYTRGQKQDYDDWAALGNEGWDYDSMLPYFKAMENQQSILNDFHGKDGELWVSDSRSAHPVASEFVQSSMNAGYPFNADFNGATQAGVGYYQVTQKLGKRHSAAAAFLADITKRKNLTILTGCQVEKILITDNKATGVRYRAQNTLITIQAAKEVILSAGAFHSPQLLMLSGIGAENELQQHNIKLVKHLPGVGKNLQDHVDAIIVNEIERDDVISLAPKSLLYLGKQLWRYWRHNTGLMTTSIVESGGFINTKDINERPDIQWQFIPGAMDDHGRNVKMFIKRGISTHVCLLRPNSRGSITLKDSNIASPPVIDGNLLSDQEDLNTMIKAVKMTRKLLSHPPLGKAIKSEIIPGKEVQTDKQIEDFLRAKSNNIYHPVGTCKMGSDDMSVVNEKLQVHGIGNLRVVDASIMPIIISANTNAPCMAIAAKAADLILEKANSQQSTS